MGKEWSDWFECDPPLSKCFLWVNFKMDQNPADWGNVLLTVGRMFYIWMRDEVRGRCDARRGGSGRMRPGRTAQTECVPRVTTLMSN